MYVYIYIYVQILYIYICVCFHIYICRYYIYIYNCHKFGNISTSHVVSLLPSQDSGLDLFLGASESGFAGEMTGQSCGIDALI